MEKPIEGLRISLQLTVVLVQFKDQGQVIGRRISCQPVYELLNGDHLRHPHRTIDQLPQVFGKK